ncbi:uncharacterized protein F4822DRAFT_409809 [Hypoxylon trugodes]|uniref:uncharacterized protein n=1 Tax=Hypoxylon trugodes TaxID=326681 RepID=UPI00218F72FE|nr:uncharacterized protein F4822DRAFT_409809 [Hypoxylon trugodes]KAI1386359.1 hypothetical protein F4822DRAFT_409809 [Hypoxylon trugodes]
MPPSTPLRGLAFARDVLSDLTSRSPPSPTPTSTTPTNNTIPIPTTLIQKLHAFATRTQQHLLPRLATDVSTVPEGYGRTPNGPEPGAVVGIVLGSIAGFILLLWLIYWCVNLGSPAPDIEEGSVGAGGSSSVVSYHSRPRIHRSSHHRSYRNGGSEYSPGPSRRRKETIEITRREGVRSRSPGPEQIVVEEEHTDRTRSRSRSVSRPRPPPPRSEDDEIVVMEEHTPPRRRDSRGYRRRSSERRSTDPYRRRSGSRR